MLLRSKGDELIIRLGTEGLPTCLKDKVARSALVPDIAGPSYQYA